MCFAKSETWNKSEYLLHPKVCVWNHWCVLQGVRPETRVGAYFAQRYVFEIIDLYCKECDLKQEWVPTLPKGMCLKSLMCIARSETWNKWVPTPPKGVLEIIDLLYKEWDLKQDGVSTPPKGMCPKSLIWIAKSETWNKSGCLLRPKVWNAKIQNRKYNLTFHVSWILSNIHFCTAHNTMIMPSFSPLDKRDPKIKACVCNCSSAFNVFSEKPNVWSIL